MPRKRKLGAVFDDTGGYFDDYYDYSETVTPQENSILDDFRQKIVNALAALDAKRNELIVTENRMYDVAAQASQNETDSADWQAHMNKIIAAQTTLDAAQNAANQLSSWWNSIKSTFGLNGLQQRGGLAGLGLLPALPWSTIGIITGGVAAVAGIIYAANGFIDRMMLKAWNDENIRRSQEGLDPLPKPELTSGDSIFTGATELGKVAIIGFAAFVLLPALVKRLEG